MCRLVREPASLKSRALTLMRRRGASIGLVGIGRGERKRGKRE